MGRYLVVSYVDTSFLQLFLWERFRTLGPKLQVFSGIDMVDFEDDDDNVMSVPEKPLKMRAHRWSGLKQHKEKRLSKYNDSKKQFVYRPYTFSPRGVAEANLYAALEEVQ